MSDDDRWSERCAEHGEPAIGEIPEGALKRLGLPALMDGKPRPTRLYACDCGVWEMADIVRGVLRENGLPVCGPETTPEVKEAMEIQRARVRAERGGIH